MLGGHARTLAVNYHLRMKTRYIAGSLAVAALMSAGAAAAQTATSAAPAITVSSSPMTSSVAAGTQGAVLGTFQFSGGPAGPSMLASVPLTLATSSGARAGDLSGCQIFNSSNTAVAGFSGALQSGVNSFTFTSPGLAFSGPSGGASNTVVYTIKCNIASAAASGGLYQVTAGTPVYAQSLMVGFTPISSVQIGSPLAPVALITLDATRSGTGVRVPGIPVTTGFSNGAASSNLTSCSVRSVTTLGTALNTGGNAVLNLGASSSFTFDTPIVVPAGTAQTYALVCAVNSATPVGATFQVGLTPSAVPASDPVSGNAMTPSALLGASGAPLATSGSVVASSVSGAPGVPNTGAGGGVDATLAILSLATLGSLLGLAYLARKQGT